MPDNLSLTHHEARQYYGQGIILQFDGLFFSWFLVSPMMSRAVPIAIEANPFAIQRTLYRTNITLRGFGDVVSVDSMNLVCPVPNRS